MLKIKFLTFVFLTCFYSLKCECKKVKKKILYVSMDMIFIKEFFFFSCAHKGT